MGTRATTERSDTWGGKGREEKISEIHRPRCEHQLLIQQVQVTEVPRAQPRQGAVGRARGAILPASPWRDRILVRLSSVLGQQQLYSKGLKERSDKSKDVLKMFLVVLI